MAVTIPNREDLLAQTLAWLLGQRPELDVSEDGPDGARIKALVELLYGLYHEVEAVQADIWPVPGMPVASLEKHAEIRLGPSARKAAVGSTGTLALRVTGTLAGASVTAGLTLEHNDGTQYQLTTGGVVGLGTLDVSVEAVDTGTATNKLIGDSLTFTSPPANIAAAAVLVVDFTGGDDAETDDELLERVLQAFRNPPAGGRFADYWAWAMDVLGVDGAYCYGPTVNALTGRRGYGIVDVAIVAAGTGAGRIPSGALAVLVADKLDSERPVTTLDTGPLVPTAVPTACDVQLTPDTGYEWDWSGSGVVSAWNAGLLRLTWTAALPATIIAAVAAGEHPRLFVNGEVLTVLTIDTVNFYTFLEAAPVVTPANPNPIYPAGPVSQPALDAIIAYYDQLGPARGIAYDPSQEWDDTVRPSQICASVVRRNYVDGTSSGVAGVKDCIVVTPAAAVTPVDHAPAGTVDLLVYPASNHPNCITVRPV
jgi:hypothetical protein